MRKDLKTTSIKKISQGDLATIKARIVAVNDQLADLGYTFDEMVEFWEQIISEWKAQKRN